jgi:CHAT domain-containing protein
VELVSISELEAGARRAEAELAGGRMATALRAYRDLLAGRLVARSLSSVELVAADLVIIERTAELSVLFGDYAAADELLAAMAQLCLQAGNVYGADWTTLKRIQIALAGSKLRDADRLVRSLEPTIGKIDDVEFSPQGLQRFEAACRWPGAPTGHRQVLFPVLYMVFAKILAALGHYGEALASVEAGLAQTGEQARDLARQVALPIRLTRAAALLEMGRLGEAGSELETVEKGLDVRLHPGLEVECLELNGKLNILAGRYGEARHCFEQVLRRCREGGFGQAELTARLNLAHVLAFLNHTYHAERLLSGLPERARELAATNMALRGELLLQVIRARRQSLAGGVAIAPSVLELWHPSSKQREATADDISSCYPPDLPQTARFLAWFEDRELALRCVLPLDLRAASERMAEMEAVFRSCDSPLVHSRLEALAGLLAYYWGDLASAEFRLQIAREAFAQMRIIPEQWQTQRVLGWCWERMKRPEDIRQSLAQETDDLLRQLVESLPGADGAVFLLNKWSAEEEGLASRVDALAEERLQSRHGFWPSRLVWRWRELRHLDDLLEGLDEHHRQLANRLLGGQITSARGPRRLQSLRRILTHPRRSVTLVFLVLPDRVVIIRIGRARLDFGVSPITRSEIREQVASWHRLMRAAARARDVSKRVAEDLPADTKKRALDIATDLAGTLQIPGVLETLPASVTALRLVLDDSLHGFPFAGIVHDGQYLIERWAISNALQTTQSSYADRLPARREALLVGISQGGPSYHLGLLPGVIPELDQISQHLSDRSWKIRRLVDGEASKEAVISQLSGAGVWHIACHGIFTPDQPDHSGLFLVSNDGDQEELLSLRELARLDLRGLRHATLSSCWSADNFILPGRRVVSLPETLCRAGVTCVLSNLWRVDDDVAVSFMSLFYNYLKTMPRDRALQRVQQDCLAGNLHVRADTKDPYFWAGFRLLGDPGSLQI